MSEKHSEITYTIEPGKKLSLIQKEFNTLFPFLKLEFFRHQHGIREMNSVNDRRKTDTILKLQHKDQSHLVINESMSVGNLEQKFQDYFGVSVQVFRKSGRSWLETSMTDDWSLKRQNDQGYELSLFAS